MNDNNNITSLVDDTIPYVGQFFNMLENAKKNYRKFVKRVRFEVKIKISRKHVLPYYVVFAYSCCRFMLSRLMRNMHD